MVALDGPTPDAIVAMVAAAFGLTPALLLGHCRTARITRARHLAMWLVRHLTSASVREVGALFGRDHATVLWSLAKVESELTTDEKLRMHIGQLEQLLVEGGP